MRDKQNLIYTQKTLIHAFFDGFMNGVTDANHLFTNVAMLFLRGFCTPKGVEFIDSKLMKDKHYSK